MMNAKLYELGHAVAAGENHVDAYMRVYGCSRESASKNAKRALDKPDMVKLVDDLRSACRMKTEMVRNELLSALLEDSRNEDLPARDRLAARAQLAKLCGLEQQRVEVSTDDAFRAAILQGCAEPVVKKK